MTGVYDVSTLDNQGKLRLERISAPSEADALRLASGNGNTVIQCKSAQGSLTPLQQLKNRLFHKNASIDPVTFSQDLSTLVGAGVSVKESIAALIARENSQARIAILRKVDAAISQGLQFSAAIASSEAFPKLLVATIAASEETGDLATGLSRYAKHQEGLRIVRDKVIGACVYPALLLSIGSLVIALLLGVVVPKFSTLIDSTGKELPALSKILMKWGHFVDVNPWTPYVLFAGMFAIMAWIYVGLKNPATRARALNVIPGVGRVAREFQHLQMYRTTSILTSRGITIHKALEYSHEFLSPQDQSRLTQSLEMMRQGKSVSASLSQSGLSDSIAISMISVAEQTGALPEMLDRVADFYERTLQRNIDIVSRLIEPVLMIIFGFVIGGIVVLMYLPIFDLASSIS